MDTLRRDKKQSSRAWSLGKLILYTLFIEKADLSFISNLVIAVWSLVIPPFLKKCTRNYLPCLQKKIEVGISFSRRHVNVVVALMSSFQNCFLRQMRHCHAFKPCHRRTDVKHWKKSVSLFSLLLLPIAVHR